MTNRIKDRLLELFQKKDKRNIIIICAAAVAVFLIFFSELIPSTEAPEKSVKEDDYAGYVESLSKQLTDIISGMEGVGSCSIMITLESTKESVYAENAEASSSQSSNSQNSEYVIYNDDNGDSPLLLKEEMPRVAGVAVVCSGGDSEAVRERIVDCVCALFSIPSSRVSVSKSTSKGGK